MKYLSDETIYMTMSEVVRKNHWLENLWVFDNELSTWLKPFNSVIVFLFLNIREKSTDIISKLFCTKLATVGSL